MKVSISAILRHRKLKFGIQIPLDLRKESCWLLGGFGYQTQNFDDDLALIKIILG